MKQFAIFIIFNTFVTGILADSPKKQGTVEYERKVLPPLTRNNYRSILKLGEVQHTVELEYHGHTYISEQTTLRDGDFIIDDKGNVISGDFTDEYVLNDGLFARSKVGALYYIFRDAEGDYIQLVTDDHHERELVEICDEIDSMSCRDEIDSSWWNAILQSRRRALSDTIEFSIKWFYAPSAVTKLGGLLQLEAAVLLAMGEANQAFSNSGLPIKTFIAGDIVEWPTEITDDDWETEFVAKLPSEDRKKGDVIGVIQGEESDYCGIAKTIPGLHGEYGPSDAFFKVEFSCLDGYTPIHEVGHLMGLGHNDGTSHCKSPHTGCGHIMACGDYYGEGNGRRTIMSYTSSGLWKQQEDYGDKWQTVYDDFPCSKEEAGSEKRIGYFSSPNVEYILNGKSIKTGSSVADSVAMIQTAMKHFPGYTDQDEKNFNANVEYGKDAFVVTGDCDTGTDTTANCVSSANYPNEYPSNSQCSVKITKDVVVLPSKKFSIESKYDKLSVEDAETKIEEVKTLEAIPKTLSKGAVLGFTSDSALEFEGWRLCFASPYGSRIFTVDGDGCDFTEDCVSSKNYPQDHGNDEKCTVNILRDTYLTSGEIFEVETGYDFLKVNSIDITSAAEIPDQLKAGDSISWESDYSLSYKGWQICFSDEPQGKNPEESESAVSLESSKAQNERLKAVNKALKDALKELVK